MANSQSMYDFQSHIKKYFIDHKQRLLTDYPGLTERRLIEEGEYFLSLEGKDLDGFFLLLSEGCPLEYINERKFFWSQDFFVNPDVLIPRFETEVLVDYVIKATNKNSEKKLSIVDIGTGSGAILLSLAIELGGEHEYLGIDICEKALSVAKRNGYLQEYLLPKLGLTWQVNDRLTGITNKFDLIVSNPPYFKSVEDRQKIHHQVLEYEPEKAVFLPDEEFEDWYRTLFSQIAECLNPEGSCFLETDSAYLPLLQQLAEDCMFTNINIYPDLTGRMRFLVFSQGGNNG